MCVRPVYLTDLHVIGYTQKHVCVVVYKGCESNQAQEVIYTPTDHDWGLLSIM